MYLPTFRFKRVTDITPAFLHEKGIRGLVLDLDNTLSRHDSPLTEIGVLDWIAGMKQADIRMMIVSNNTKSRVEPLAQALGLPHLHFCCKPLPFGIRRAIFRMKLRGRQTALVGDQLFTDVLGGKFAGIRTILVEPFHLESKPTIRFKRRLERILIGRKIDQ
jgi:HAD superfamily phosphatase (TIGR01668 family)